MSSCAKRRWKVDYKPAPSPSEQKMYEQSDLQKRLNELKSARAEMDTMWTASTTSTTTTHTNLDKSAVPSSDLPVGHQHTLWSSRRVG